ncbi:hypothetical protein [Flavobacterium ginsenosidimutans]|uniref:Uncharacterized protein n=1 Tax=Flavobacterium ginsenosidimutans TaxID=687844 RepID=A0ABZ2Q7G4_9FLAO|nr:hypothetical protein [Flavobacterium ginsenosidimutans]KAF2327888.1 hypothetical protein DM444_18975 [Flavobacterium ginsenosidimutans]
MLILKTLNSNFKISTIDLELFYTESKGAKIAIEVIKNGNEEYSRVEIDFFIVAEVKCVTLNFFESNYSNYLIKYFGDNEKPFDSGFYEVMDSAYLKENIEKYDPKMRFDLKHYIVTGNDSYVEIIASKYSVY